MQYCLIIVKLLHSGKILPVVKVTNNRESWSDRAVKKQLPLNLQNTNTQETKINN